MQVPIYSASFSAARHPGILRTLYVDSSITPAHDFILNLIVLGLMMLNAGLDDQGLISHLSEATAGAWRGVGHSNAYEDPGGYDLAVNYLLKTSSPMGGSLVVEPFSARDAKNDYELPWILRGVMDDPHAVELFRAEIKALKDTILTWQPDTRALREIKKRVRSGEMRYMMSLSVEQRSSHSLSRWPDALQSGYINKGLVYDHRHLQLLFIRLKETLETSPNLQQKTPNQVLHRALPVSKPLSLRPTHRLDG
jgi:hypothetical protein